MTRRQRSLLIVIVAAVGGFIASFALITKMRQPVTMKLQSPEGEKKPVEEIIKGDSTITIFILGNNLLFYYEGRERTNGKLIPFTEVRNYLTGKSKNGNNFLMIIKPAAGSTDKNTVDLLDEMTINKIHNFAMVKITEEESSFVDSIEKRARNVVK